MLIQSRLSARSLAALLGVSASLVRRASSGIGRVYRTRGGLFLPAYDARLDRRNNVIAVVRGLEGLRLGIGHNIVTDAGDVFYARKWTGEVQTNAFARLALGTGKTGAWAKNGAPSLHGNLTGAIAGSVKAFDGGFPASNNADAGNVGGGANVATYKVSYSDADFTTVPNVTDGDITIAAPVGGSPTLAGFTLTAPFNLGAGESVAVYVNHSTTGQ